MSTAIGWLQGWGLTLASSTLAWNCDSGADWRCATHDRAADSKACVAASAAEGAVELEGAGADQAGSIKTASVIHSQRRMILRYGICFLASLECGSFDISVTLNTSSSN